MVRVGLRTVVLDVPPQDVITRDNVSVKVNAVVYFRVMDAAQSRSSKSRTTTTRRRSCRRRRCAACWARSIWTICCRSATTSNQELQQILDLRTDPWGVKVSAVEVKHVDLPENMQRAMAKQAEAEREKRAKIIHAAGELDASEKLSQAAAVIATEPVAITLRYLQTLTEIAAEKNSTIIFPLPIELLNMLRPVAGGTAGAASPLRVD